jgi:hypothetical protein
MLHVTNGSSAGNLIACSGLAGGVVTWDDVLHEGPVPARVGPGALGQIRAWFLTNAGWGDYPTIVMKLADRDERLGEAVGREPIVLWFEADLYDQLQLLQILDFLSEADDVTLVCIDAALGGLEPGRFPSLFETREPVQPDAYKLARRAWNAFRDTSPEAVDRLRAEDLSRLPYLADALTRLLQELPWSTDGLSRTERALLMPLYDGPRPFDEAFQAQMQAEERPFLGDSTALWRLSLLARGQSPLLTVGDELALTEHGRRVLEGKLDAVELRGIDRCLGGIVLGPEIDWRWDPIRGVPVLR